MKTITRGLSALRAVPAVLLVLVATLAVAFVSPAHASTISLLGFAGSTLASANPTLLDLAKRLDPNGSVADVVEILNETNEVLDDMTWLEGNLPTGHRTVVRTGIPAPTWRKMYGGVSPGKSTTAAVTDTCGMLEAYSQDDKALADHERQHGGVPPLRDKAFLEGMSEEVAGTLFYGNQSRSPKPSPASRRASPVSTSTAQSADNVITAAPAPTTHEIWLVVWGPRTVHGIVPKGSKAGFQQTDKGQMTIQNSDGSMYEAYVTHYRWDAGLTVRDWRYVGRVCNIDVSDIATVAQHEGDDHLDDQGRRAHPEPGRGPPGGT
jgi:hypothetical protein